MTLFYETVSLATIEPSFATELNPHASAYPLYHYYDCTCDVCAMNHRFYCGDQSCEYCAAVSDVLYRMDVNSTECISYVEFMALEDDVIIDDMIMYFCTQCNDRIPFDLWKEQEEGKELCAACQKNQEETFYCSICEDTEVDEDGDICDYCSSESNHGYVVSEDEYEYIEEAWIAPNGDLYIVSGDDGGHETAAKLMGFRGTDDCENAGYIHLTDCYGHDFEYVPEDYTEKQVNTVMTLCEIKGWEYPDFIQEYMDRGTVVEQVLITADSVQKMQNLNPSWLSMPRKQRDIFYPLSGD